MIYKHTGLFFIFSVASKVSSSGIASGEAAACALTRELTRETPAGSLVSTEPTLVIVAVLQALVK